MELEFLIEAKRVLGPLGFVLVLVYRVYRYCKAGG